MKQLGRSMIEMLGVLAIIGVLSICGIALYRRAVNNHHANTILDDVNRFAFVITERGNFTIDAEIPKGDFKESGLYTLKGYQAESGQYSITVKDVPKGVCEPLVDKGVIDYKVGVVTAGHDVTEEILFDTLHTDLCQETNDVAFYFGNTSAVCNGNEDEPAECTTNADCCGEYFCAFQDESQENGTCMPINAFGRASKTIIINGIQTTWTVTTGKYEGKCITWWSTQNWCAAQGLKPATREDIGCVGNNIRKSDDRHTYCESPFLQTMQSMENWTTKSWHWLESNYNSGRAVYFSDGMIYSHSKFETRSKYALCH